MAEETGDRSTFAHALLNVGASELTVDRDRGWSDVERARQLATEQGSQEHAVRAHAVFTCQSIMAHDYETAERVTEAGVRFAREHDIDAFAHYLIGWRAQMRLDQGEWAEADRDADSVMRERQFSTVMRFPAMVVAGTLRARRGEAGAETLLDEAWVFANRTGEMQRIAPAAIARAEAAWLAGDLEKARATAAGFEVSGLRVTPWYAGALAFWSWQAGGRYEAPNVIAEPFRVQIEGRWREAADAWAAIGCPYNRALALADGDEGARRESFDILDRLGAHATIGRLRRALRSRGVRALPRGPGRTTRENPARLTPTQMKVLALVVRGLPNTEIARMLYLSPRTVDHHVSAILAKLGVRARGEVAEAARTKGLVV
jgi:DNA-binding CsgD family transcriptional regulator